MKVLITVTKIKRGSPNKTLLVAGPHHLDLANAALFAEGTLLAVRDVATGDIYSTSFVYSGAAAVLAAAPNTGGFHVFP